jgi:uroporphyrinogen-III decarboxylase
MPEKLKALRLLREHFGNTVLVTGSCAAPYSCASLILGLEETMVLALTDPQLLAEFCEFCIELEYRYIKAQHQAGAHAIWVGDCNAFSGMLSLEQYKQFAFGPCRKLIEKVKRDTDVIVYLHNSEEKMPNLLAQAELGADIINLGPGADMAEVRQAMMGRCCFSGNLDPIEVLANGTPELVARETQRIVDMCREPGGFLFCTGEMNPRGVPVENMRALAKTIKNANRT